MRAVSDRQDLGGVGAQSVQSVIVHKDAAGRVVMGAVRREPIMTRNLDIAAVRSFLTVAEMGGVTRAATQLNLTQSAVSLQIKRLEETFGRPLLERGAGAA